MNFLPLILRSSPNTGMMRFFGRFRFLCTGIKRKNYCYRRGSQLWKNVFIKSIVEKGPPPLDPALTHLVTVGTEIAVPHKQQVTVAASAAVFSLKSLGTPFMMQ